MTKKIWRRNEIQSPCIQVCVVDRYERLCTGCHRSLDEIARWSSMSSDERERVLVELPSRATRLRKRRGGRKGRVKQRQKSG
ncbi:MAG: DUF1289 domain-containing protein [Aestuariivita sp.]|nr:DUF1289 domain-containing protein [Aestuariivita sp.]